MTLRRCLAAGALAATFTLAVATPAAATTDPEPLEVVGFLGEQRIAPGGQFDGTTVGGFSGLDFDEHAGTWYVIADDRSALQPARFYTADLAFNGTTEDGLDGALSGVELTGTTPFLQEDGTPFPPLSAGTGTTVDPEDIRVDPRSGELVWSQEGERIVPTDGTAPTLIDPGVNVADVDGSFIATLPTPEAELVDVGASGIRQNLGPEGLTFAKGGDLVVTALEGPLLQDAPTATRTAGTLSRIVQQDRDGNVVAQYAYPQEPVFADPTPADGFASTGVTALLAVDEQDPDRYLAIERSFVTGVGNKVVVYEVDLAGATDISGGTPVSAATPVTKRVLFDVADLPVESVDNIEGMAWGPDRADGSRTLVLVSDDNFSATQVTQFIAVAVR